MLLPRTLRADATGPQVSHGVMTGDVSRHEAVVWARASEPARMWVSWWRGEDRDAATTVMGPAALDEDDYTAKMVLECLPEGAEINYEVFFQSLADVGRIGRPFHGCFRTPSWSGVASVKFGWSGDLCGQGFGIDLGRGGYKIFDALSAEELDFFIFSGDMIYADNPLVPEYDLGQGQVWHNVMVPEKVKVAESLGEFRGNFRYNLLDVPFRTFLSRTPLVVQWDDHEVRNNWFPGQVLEADIRYSEKSADLLSARARRAFMEYTPIHPDVTHRDRVYRKISRGPLLDVFVLDMRSYRGPNSKAEATDGPETLILGREQVQWLLEALHRFKARWKVIACDMPLGLIVPDGAAFEAVASSPGPPRGREVEIAALLQGIRQRRIKNVVWLTADVHYAAAHFYDPNQARMSDFLPFWEFVAGPLHAGTCGPNTLDDTFGPQQVFCNLPPGMAQNRPPSDGLQSYGVVEIVGKDLTVSLKDVVGRTLYQMTLEG